MTNESKNIYKTSVQEMAFFCYFGIMLFAKGIGLYEGQLLYNIVLIIGFSFIVVKIIFTKNTILEWSVIVLLIFLGGMIYLSSSKIGALIIIMTIIGMKNISVNRVMKVGLIIWSVTFTLQVLMTLTGIREDIIRVQEKLGLGYVIRYSLGAPHPNVLQISYVILCAFVIYKYHFVGRKLLLATMVMLLGNIYFFFYSVSYTGVFITFSYLLINLYLSKLSKFRLFDKIIIYLTLPCAVCFSVLGPLLIKEPYFTLINKILNTRFYISKNFMMHNGITYFGIGYCDDIPSTLNNLDSSYVFLLMHYGLIFFILIVVSYIFLIRYLLRENKRIELGITLGLIVAAIAEPFFVNTSFKNISIIFLGNYLYEVSKKTEGKEYSIIIDKEIMLNTRAYIWFADVLKKIKKYVVSNIRYVIIMSFVIGAVFALLGGAFINRETTYYFNRYVVQIEDEDYLTLDIDNLPEDFNGRIVQYIDKNTPMVRIDDNIGTIEYIRKVVSLFIWGGLLSSLVVSVLGIQRQQTKRYNENNKQVI